MRNTVRWFSAAINLALMMALAAPHCAAAGYTPWAEEAFPMHLYWGDTHLHSAYSVDANTMGNTALTPADAYRFVSLDRLRVLKGWRDASGALHEKVHKVAVSDNRKIASDGRVDPLKATVDLDSATYLNTIGEAQLSAYWQDPQFDPAEAAFYYARVIEIPTPRWTAYDAVRLGKTLNANDPRIVQDRAYSSPIWYNPE